jgi:hypothetical protein
MLIPCISLAVSLACLGIVIYNARRTWRYTHQIKRDQGQGGL